MILVTTDTNTLLVYQQTSLCWSAQLDITPVMIARGQFQNISGVLVMLSETGELQCCYLGTEPSLFVAPPLELNAISYQNTEQELRELNIIIKEHTKAN
ncbi:unnamed protein product, partial [Timema podura]|nr:unnamed protein product [Timema podura]